MAIDLFHTAIDLYCYGGRCMGKWFVMELDCLRNSPGTSEKRLPKLISLTTGLLVDGRKLSNLVCTLKDTKKTGNLVSSTIEDLGRIDFLVNNGGGQFLSSVENMSSKGFKAVVDTNLIGTFLMCKEVHSQYMKENGGSIVNIIADMFRGFPMMAHTGAARSAVDNLTKSLSVEWAADGVRVNAVAPGSSIYSETAAKNYGNVDIFDAVKEHVPAKRLGTTMEVSSSVCFLLSPGASFISGATLRVDAAGSLYSPLLYRISEHDKLPSYDWTYEPPQDDAEGENTKSKL
ncbi:unnamed protein product, partial [Meganyctiphanes norvegica]